MNETIRQLEPRNLWNYFADINAIPRASKKEEKIVSFVKNLSERLGLPTHVDEVGNVIIKKPASSGMQDRATVVLQSHLDMVHQKNADTDFDFATQGIDMFVDGDWVKAKGTTLGADNGIGVATILALLASSDIPHPPLEALFTIDEETGMTGALSLKGGLLQGNILLNLDTEEDNELTIGCAGGMDVTVKGSYREVHPKGNVAYQISLTGLTGGHSGTEIHLGRGNANKLMNRFLYHMSKQFPMELSSLKGGSLRNAIPRESFAIVVIEEANSAKLEKEVALFLTILLSEYKFTDPDLKFSMVNVETPENVLDADFQKKLIGSIYACPNGIYRLTPAILDLVQTSNNVAKIEVSKGKFAIDCLTRSSVNSEKQDIASAITACFEVLQGEVTFGGSYPGWVPKPDAPIVQLMRNVYKELFHDEAHVYACHAGLECGILGTNYPNMQMISFGPTIRGAHSPDERVQISSVQKFWKYLLETLQRIPESSNG